MSDLLTGLTSAARALDAQTFGLDVTGQNIANMNTPGYVRRTVNLTEVPATDSRMAGRGVEVAGMIAERAPLLEARIRQEQPAAARERAVAESLSLVESRIGAPGRSADSSLTQFYDAFAQLAEDPTSGSKRQQVLVQAQALSQTFNDVSSRLTSARRDADTSVRSGVDQVNALASRIGSLNASISSAGATERESLIDQEIQALGDLSSLVDISVVQRSDGGADVSVGNGHALVIGANVYQLAAASAGPLGLADLTTGGTTITGEITGGRLGGLLRARDVLIPGYLTQLDQLAYGVVTSVNSAHTAGYDVNGTAGVNFFSALASPTGAAAAMAPNPTVLADPNRIAAASTPAAGDNQTARTIANLRYSVIPSGTANPVDTWGALVYRVGTDAQVAKNNQTSREDVVKQLQTLRDQTSGVSLDEEAAMMLKFQRAYEANARFFTTVNQVLDTLIQALRV